MKANAAEILQGQIESGEYLLAHRPISPESLSEWKTAARASVEWIYGAESDAFRSFIGGGGGIASVPINPSEQQMENSRAEAVQRQVAKLKGLLRVHLATHESSTQLPRLASVPCNHGRVFVVHGHDDRYRLETARFIEQLGLEAVLLQEQPNTGRMLLDKFEDNATASDFAVVLLTPDDRGGTAGTPSSKQRARARQNVIFELGYFIGKLGRSRVCALYLSTVELPSDIQGISHIELDVAGAWKVLLARELNAAKLPVNAKALVR